MRFHRTWSVVAALVALGGLALKLQAGEQAGTKGDPEVVRLVEETRLPTALILHLAGNDLGTADRLARTGRYLVNLLAAADQVEPLRRAALASGVSGRVVVDALPANGRLPHPSRFVDVIIHDPAAAAVETAELHRVLTVGGTLLTRTGGRWQALPRQAEEGIDDWTHKWHGPSGQVLSLDRKAGPPTTVQWLAGPALADGAIGGKHPVIGGGAFAAVDNVDGAVQVRSAGSGLPRWRGPFGLPFQAVLLLDGDRLLCRPPPVPGAGKSSAETGPLTAFDLRTGDKALAYTEAPQVATAPGSKIKPAFPATLALGRHLVVAAGAELAVLDRGSGKRLWTRKLDEGTWFSPVALDGILVACECAAEKPPTRARIDNSPGVGAVAAFAVADGTPRWRVTIDRQAPPLLPLVAAEGLVFLHTASYQSRQPGAYVAALDLRDGKQLWRQELPDGTRNLWSSTDSASRVICRDGTLYYIGGHSLGHVVAWDARTGKTIHEPQRRPKFVGYGGECSGSLATVKWLIMSGTTWWDADYKVVSQPAARSACGTGVFPAQGMVFTNPTGCDCTQYVRGYLGLGCEPLPAPVADEQRLVRGPAFGKVAAGPAGDAWPTLLGNPQRSGTTPHALPAKLRELWRTSAAPAPIAGPLLEDRRRDEYWNGPLTAPVVAGDTVVVGLADAHAVAAFDAATGRRRWQVPLGGPVDTPPTLHAGLCLVGSGDGAVQALTLADGALAWRFQAAPAARPAVLNGRLGSAFPVPGSVLVRGDTLLATSGCHSYLGGLHVWALDVPTGAVRGRSVVTGGEPPTQANMVFNDVLSAGRSGEDAWIFRHFRLGWDAKQQDVPKREAGTHYPGDVATAVILDRRAAVVRFPHNQRGGSTHGWRTKMTSGSVSAFRVVRDGPLAYALDDPTEQARRYNTEVILRAQRADAVRYDQKAEPLWTKRPADLGQKESYTALLKAGDRLYLGGGSRDGRAGFVQVVSAADGSLIQELELPAPVAPCGQAAAGGRLLVSCLDGSLIGLGQ